MEILIWFMGFWDYQMERIYFDCIAESERMSVSVGDGEKEVHSCRFDLDALLDVMAVLWQKIGTNKLIEAVM